MYIHERKEWPEFRWEPARLAALLADVRRLQGRLLGRIDGLGFELREEATLQTIGWSRASKPQIRVRAVANP